MAAPASSLAPWLLPFAFCAASLRLGYYLQGREGGSPLYITTSLKSSGFPELVGELEAGGEEQGNPWEKAMEEETSKGRSDRELHWGQGSSYSPWTEGGELASLMTSFSPGSAFCPEQGAEGKSLGELPAVLEHPLGRTEQLGNPG